MEGSASRGEVMKPVLLKAGIPLAISVAGLIYARFMAGRGTTAKASLPENQVDYLESDPPGEFAGEEGPHSFNAAPSPSMDDEHQMITTNHYMGWIGSSRSHDKCYHEEEILGLRSRLEELQNRECELEKQFICYQDMKDQESMLMELKNTLSLEAANVELLDREVSYMEAEYNRLENLVMQYVSFLGQLEHLKSETGLLQRKVKRLTRKSKQQSLIIKEKNSRIATREGELLRSLDELETKSNIIKQLEGDVMEVQATVAQLQEQNNELLSMLNSASSNYKVEDEEITMTTEDYNRLASEHENLQRDRAAEVKELVYLRWSNACLRHELMRSRMQQEHSQENRNHRDQLEFEGHGNIEERQLEALVLEQSSHVYPKRPKLLQKLKKWVEGSERPKTKLDEKEKHEIKCFGRHSVSDEAEEHLVPARKSCSSV